MNLNELRKKVEDIQPDTFNKWEIEASNITPDYVNFFTELLFTFLSKVQQDRRPEIIFTNFLFMLWILEEVGIIEFKDDIYFK